MREKSERKEERNRQKMGENERECGGMRVNVRE